MVKVLLSRDKFKYARDVEYILGPNRINSLII